MKIINFVLLIFIAGVLAIACTTENDYEIGPLSKEEKNDILRLKQEEKLARDIYYKAYKTYGFPVFSNLYEGEQYHLNNVNGLISRFMINDTTAVDTGIFSYTSFQTFYDTSIILIDSSFINAYLTGITLEEMIISDIEKYEKGTEEADVLDVYRSIKCWSKNHLRLNFNFYGGDSTFQPAFLPTGVFFDIVNSDYESCP